MRTNFLILLILSFVIIVANINSAACTGDNCNSRKEGDEATTTEDCNDGECVGGTKSTWEFPCDGDCGDLTCTATDDTVERVTSTIYSIEGSCNDVAECNAVGPRDGNSDSVTECICE